VTSDPPIYLDANATTPLDPRVAAVMRDALDLFGNPSSGHAYGREARAALDLARARVAALLGCSPAEIVFTSGGTEANNHALKGAAWARAGRGRHLVISAVEHPAVRGPAAWLAARGWETTTVPVDRDGRVDPADVARAVRPDTVLVSVMHANNEVGTLQPIAEIAGIARAAGALMHTDAAQSAGKVAVRVGELGIDLLSLAGHKLYGPKGVGALFVRGGVTIENLSHGAGHEAGRRPGTESVLLAAGLGEAARIAAAELGDELPRLTRLRDRLEAALVAGCPDAVVHARGAERLPNTLSLGFPGARADRLLAALPGVACSAGAACHGGGAEVSAVLAAMGAPREAALGTLRFSVGRFTSREDVDRAAPLILSAVAAAREGR